MIDKFLYNSSKIKNEITPPEIPEKIVIFDFPKKETDENFAFLINRTISETSQNGGGKILIPSGKYYSKGPVVFKSNIGLVFEGESTVTFSHNPKDFLVGSKEFAGCVLTSFEGTLCYNYSPLIYAESCRNISLSGDVVFDAQGDKSWALFRDKQSEDRSMLQNQNNDGTLVEERIYGEGHYLRPSFLYFFNCTNINISDVKFVNSAFWNLHPFLCSNINISNLRFESQFINSDGIDLEYCENVYIHNCHFKLHDDNIAIKSGRDLEGSIINRPSKNILVENCSFCGLNGFSIGSEIAGGAENIYVQNCYTSGPLIYGILIKTNLNRGGIIRNVFIQNMEFDTCMYGIKIDMDYKKQREYERIPQISDIYFKNIHFGRITEKSISVNGLTQSNPENIHFSNIKIDGVDPGNNLMNSNVTFND